MHIFHRASLSGEVLFLFMKPLCRKRYGHKFGKSDRRMFMSKVLGLNPYLPFWETVPDGEPHVFEGRIYIFGSHDKRNGTSFCEDDYAVWSAPVEDKGNWRFEGIVYQKEQDPINGAPYEGVMPEFEPSFTGDGLRLLYAPDVARGPDGRYYLFYALDTVNVISVAVCDTPAGKYEFLDYVRRADGTVPKTGRWFDPAVLVEESGNYLYYGFCPPVRFPGMEDLDIPGGMAVKLADDMHTIISDPVCTARGVDTCKGTDYEEHPFFEASSIRKFGDWYYLVYSSLQGHELCYGMSKTPMGPFAYKGVIVSNGDIGFEGQTQAVNYTGNNHGGLVEIGDQMYIFWHRHTHGTAFNRQGCADEVKILEDGTIPQISITSCGLNDGPLPAKGCYQTYIACHLTEADCSRVGQVVMAELGGGLPPVPEERPYITEEEDPKGEHGLKPFIYNLRQGAVAGFKYFAFQGDESEIVLELRGTGTVEVWTGSPGEGQAVASVSTDSKTWTKVPAGLAKLHGTYPLYFVVSEGVFDFASFEIV